MDESNGMALREYKKKRDFTRTPEPAGSDKPGSQGRLYVIQKHAASHLHYDLRLEMGGVLKSWAVPKGPSLDPEEKRLAVHVEDHPVEYGSFEGVIPEGEYGGGTVMIWDFGKWEPDGDAEAKYRKGHLTFRLLGKKLKGTWTLARMGGPSGEEGKNWLLIKKKDEEARRNSEYDILEDLPESEATGRTMDQIRRVKDRVWSGTEGEITPDPASLPGARRSAMPAQTKPQLATLVKDPPTGDRWVHEVKYDGYRILCFKTGNDIRLVSRNGNDWTGRFPSIVKDTSSLAPQRMILDGEIVVLRADGTTDFQALQNAYEGLVPWGKIGRIGYYIFDILYYEGFDLTGTPLVHRKELLGKVLLKPLAPPSLLYGDHIRGRGSTVYQQACRLGFEGIVSKREDGRYEQRRSTNWLKVKCQKRQEFVIGGYSEPSGSRTGFGALLLGFYEKSGELVYAGRVGTGFNEASLGRLMSALRPLEQKQSSFRNSPKGREARGVQWVRPELVAEVEFTEWTKEGILRHPSFKGLREDKRPREVIRESPEPSDEPAAGEEIRATTRKMDSRPRQIGKQGKIAGVAITNPGRILYPDQGLTKTAVAAYYESVAERMIPHLENRPLSLVRCPQGRQRKCFYQKHLTEQTPDVVREIPVQEKEEVSMYVAVNDLQGLISLVQLGVLEFHPWGSRADHLEQPDRLIFDLDPGEGVVPGQILESVQLLRTLLEELGFVCFLKATGGKGYHVVAPITRGPDWEELKEFAMRVAQLMVRMRPALLVSVMNKSKRKGKIFVDYLRNGRGSTAVAPYSTRARPAAPVAAPISWKDLTPSLMPDQYNVGNISQLLRRPDPWADFFRIRQSITKTMKRKLDSIRL
jgi:bifunctional non-homologous end joining protein LigD